MSNARSPREVCSTTIGTNGLMPLLCCLSSTKLTVALTRPSADTHGAPTSGPPPTILNARFPAGTSSRTPQAESREPPSRSRSRSPSRRGEQPAPTGADANRPAPDDACTPPTTAVLAGSRLLASRGLLLFLRLCWCGGLLRGANRFRSFGRHPLLLWLRGLLSMPFYAAAGAPSTAGMLKPIRLCLGSAVRTLLLI